MDGETREAWSPERLANEPDVGLDGGGNAEDALHRAHAVLMTAAGCKVVFVELRRTVRCRKACPRELSRRYKTQRLLQGSTLQRSPGLLWAPAALAGAVTHSWKHLHINNAPFQGEHRRAHSGGKATRAMTDDEGAGTGLMAAANIALLLQISLGAAGASVIKIMNINGFISNF